MFFRHHRILPWHHSIRNVNRIPRLFPRPIHPRRMSTSSERANVALCTTPSEEVAKNVARHILEHKLAACVNIVPKITSMYWWEGKVQADEEYLLVIKTMQDEFNRLKEAIIQVHPYDVPEVISLTIEDGNEAYLNWIRESVGRSQ